MAADDGRRAVGTVLAEQLAEIECERKVPYATKAIAKREARRIAAEGLQVLTAYRCRWCRAFHLGHRQPGTCERYAPAPPACEAS